MRNTLFYPAATFLRLSSILLLSFILSVPFMEVKAETATGAINTKTSNTNTTNTNTNTTNTNTKTTNTNTTNTNTSVTQPSVGVPANVATWMDDELRKAKRKTLLTREEFFTQDSARVVGYIAGYHAGLEFSTVTLRANNDLTFEKRPIVSKIDSMGRFMCTIAMNHPRMVTISFGEEFMDLYLEPGQTLALSFDWKDCVRTDCFRKAKEVNQVLLLQGSLARLNYELKAFKLKTLGNRHYWIINSYSPQAYLAVIDSILIENEASVKEGLASGKYLKRP